jgi:aspartate aminotransferase
MSVVSKRVRRADAAFAVVRDFYFKSRYGERRFEPGVCDFTFGNPHEMPLGGLVDAIRHRAVPKDKNWFAYKTSEEVPQKFLAEKLSEELGLGFEPEVVFSEPAWFCYEPMLYAADAVPKKIKLTAKTFDLDLGAIEAAIGPKTKMVIVNTPQNPTGRIVAPETLRALAGILERASQKIGHRIFLLSDEPYRRLRFDGNGFASPAKFYPWTLISYSYGKVLLAPGQRLGYLALSPLMAEADKAAFRETMFSAQMALGWCFPNAVMQYAVPDLETLSIDVQALTRRRDLLSETLTGAGYDVLLPEGTFYLWSKWPKGDPDELWNALADRDVFVLPGSMMNEPEFFRISLTASDEMVERALRALEEIAK